MVWPIVPWHTEFPLSLRHLEPHEAIGASYKNSRAGPITKRELKANIGSSCETWWYTPTSWSRKSLYRKFPQVARLIRTTGSMMRRGRNYLRSWQLTYPRPTTGTRTLVRELKDSLTTKSAPRRAVSRRVQSLLRRFHSLRSIRKSKLGIQYGLGFVQTSHPTVKPNYIRKTGVIGKPLRY